MTETSAVTKVAGIIWNHASNVK